MLRKIFSQKLFVFFPANVFNVNAENSGFMQSAFNVSIARFLKFGAVFFDE